MDQLPSPRPALQSGDALIVVDVQNDFLPGGSLAAPHGDEIIPVLNRYLAAFAERGNAIFATRDWHPPNHCSFQSQDGPWPVHCVRDTPGAAFAPGLKLPESTVVISKATAPTQEAYSGFEATDLEQQLLNRQVRRLFIGGLATDYCVLSTTMDALYLGFPVFLLRDAIRAVNAHPDDGPKAEAEMLELGATPVTWQALEKA